MGYTTGLGIVSGADLLLRDLIHERSGIFFDNNKTDILKDKLSPLVIDRGFNSFLDYYYLLKYDAESASEWLRVMDALSVPETYFWREMDQVRALVDIVIPEWSRRNSMVPFRIWSSACAGGEEPLTLAMAINEAGWFDRLTIEIIASDASTAAIERARTGEYRERAFRNLPPFLKAKYFSPIDSRNAWRVSESLKTRITYSVCNLMDVPSAERLASANTIFCRNVFIYFSTQSIAKTLQSFAARIRRPGYLFVGISESLIRLASEFELKEIGNAFVYQKRDLAEEFLTSAHGSLGD